MKKHKLSLAVIRAIYLVGIAGGYHQSCHEGVV
ncbi:hypothetical protein SRABI106_00544 [Rahnella aquatilis]|nr:hypothetical protein SRABI106_00544 [Rahnella aquatilis]